MLYHYKCPNGHTIVTKCEVVNAVLPVFIDCVNCRELATMLMPADTDTSNVTITHEWYIPIKTRGLTKEDNKRFKKHGIYLRPYVAPAVIEEKKELIEGAVKPPKKEPVNESDYPYTLVVDAKNSEGRYKAGSRWRLTEWNSSSVQVKRYENAKGKYLIVSPEKMQLA